MLITEVEKFVTANTQELSKDKWLCPISGKKFKGPEFVRKHIFNKHAEKVEEVKTEVSFFNNYLMDPKRPSLPENPKNKQQQKPERHKGDHFSGSGGMGFQGHQQQGMMGGYNQPRPHMMGYSGGHYGSHGGFGGGRDYYPEYNRRSGGGYPRHFSRRSDPRGLIEYRDLDAPDDGDIF
ncbi:hypothetical protein FSP39_015336 [Pinctada imbricata]|uniref:SERRATE/Ars2 C-terminal domain-containing protein n=1 Tax=Pinctada imbricata TaxID=66713 RepID=A0AA89BX77_PINIB|nr:hypothetical protein FSP39_015336 [Pinctada imbricata]